MNMAIGQKLPNGAIIINARQREDAAHRPVGEWVVLALASPDSSHPELVTWLSDEDGNTYWGHYFSDIVKATESYTTR